MYTLCGIQSLQNTAIVVWMIWNNLKSQMIHQCYIW